MSGSGAVTISQRAQVIGLIGISLVAAYFSWLDFGAYRDLYFAIEQAGSPNFELTELNNRFFGLDISHGPYGLDTLLAVANQELQLRGAVLRNSLLLLACIWGFAFTRLVQAPRSK